MEVAEEGNHSMREAQCIPGQDPIDINRGFNYLFLKEDANERMRRNKRKNKYVFLETEDSQNTPEGKSNNISSGGASSEG